MTKAMESPSCARWRRGRFPCLTSTSSLLLVLLVLLCARHADASRTPEPRRIWQEHRLANRPLQRRDPNEHVVLADCRDDGSTAFSSQVAYFPSVPGDTPQDVAVVVTNPGQTRVWAGQTTRVTFTTTGVNFTAVLGPQVPAGALAGTGFNDYVGFICFNRFKSQLYKYDGRTCSMVYDCSHEALPAANATLTTPDPTAGPTSTGNNNNNPSQTTTSRGGTTQSSSSSSNSPDGAAPSQGLSTGGLVGVVVGGVCAALIAAGAAVFVCVHRRRVKAAAAELDAAAAATEGDPRGPPPPGTPGWMYAGSEKKDWGVYSPGSSPHQGMRSPATVRHELDGMWRGAEVVGDGSYPELGGRQLTPELEGNRTSRGMGLGEEGGTWSQPPPPPLSPRAESGVIPASPGTVSVSAVATSPPLTGAGSPEMGHVQHVVSPQSG